MARKCLIGENLLLRVVASATASATAVASATAPPREKFKKFSATYASVFNKATLQTTIFHSQEL